MLLNHQPTSGASGGADIAIDAPLPCTHSPEVQIPAGHGLSLPTLLRPSPLLLLTAHMGSAPRPLSAIFGRAPARFIAFVTFQEWGNALQLDACGAALRLPEGPFPSPLGRDGKVA